MYARLAATTIDHLAGMLTISRAKVNGGASMPIVLLEAVDVEDGVDEGLADVAPNAPSPNRLTSRRL